MLVYIRLGTGIGLILLENSMLQGLPLADVFMFIIWTYKCRRTYMFSLCFLPSSKTDGSSLLMQSMIRREGAVLRRLGEWQGGRPITLHGRDSKFRPTIQADEANPE